MILPQGVDIQQGSHALQFKPTFILMRKSVWLSYRERGLDALPVSYIFHTRYNIPTRCDQKVISLTFISS